MKTPIVQRTFSLDRTGKIVEKYERKLVDGELRANACIMLVDNVAVEEDSEAMSSTKIAEHFARGAKHVKIYAVLKNIKDLDLQLS